MRGWRCSTPTVELHAVAPAALGGESTIYRGHEGARGLLSETYRRLSQELRIEISEIRDLRRARSSRVGQLRRAWQAKAGQRSSLPDRVPI